ncbi:MAG: carbonic anhydrase [Mycobacterium sp.]
MPNTNPVTAWKALKEGNERFVAGEPEHPSQSVEHRASLADAQQPTAVVFGCGDSRVAAEIIFDQGLGDMFVVRTAGHVIDSAVLGSIEYGVTVLDVPLIVVLGHDSCGAVKATLAALDDGVLPGGYVRDLVERVTPSILLGRREGLTRVDEFEARHVTETGAQLLMRSAAIAERVAAGTLAIVGVTYHLADGRAVLRDAIGDIGVQPGGER